MGKDGRVWVGAWKVYAPQSRVRVESIGSADHLGRVMQSCLDASSWSALLMISLMSDWKQVAVEALG
jgi:hypothetical protein